MSKQTIISMFNNLSMEERKEVFLDLEKCMGEEKLYAACKLNERIHITTKDLANFMSKEFEHENVQMEFPPYSTLTHEEKVAIFSEMDRVQSNESSMAESFEEVPEDAFESFIIYILEGNNGDGKYNYKILSILKPTIYVDEKTKEEWIDIVNDKDNEYDEYDIREAWKNIQYLTMLLNAQARREGQPGEAKPARPAKK